MSRIIATLLLIVACGDNEPACTEATRYSGPVVWCQGLPGEAVCMADKQTGPVMCRALCAETGPACGAGEFWNTMLVTMDDGAHGSICYCEPNPTLTDRSTLDL